MKEAELNLDLTDLPDNLEESTNFDISVDEYSMSQAELELPEDLTEKVINYIEREERSSYEYKKYINYLKNELDLTKCSLLPNLDCSTGAASLEFHHYPMNLYEITETVGKKMLDNLTEGETVSCFDIAEKVMEEHYLGNIGLVPLTKTLHDMAHNRSIIIPISKVNGNYKRFLQKYNSYIDEDIKDRIKEAELTSDEDDAKLYNSRKLEKNISKYNIEYVSREENDEY